jgi:hypothetical protein
MVKGAVRYVQVRFGLLDRRRCIIQMDTTQATWALHIGGHNNKWQIQNFIQD